MRKFSIGFTIFAIILCTTACFFNVRRGDFSMATIMALLALANAFFLAEYFR